jgi:hypothetical protein
VDIRSGSNEPLFQTTSVSRSTQQKNASPILFCVLKERQCCKNSSADSKHKIPAQCKLVHDSYQAELMSKDCAEICTAIGTAIRTSTAYMLPSSLYLHW